MNNIPNFDPLFDEVVAYVKEHQGEKGYIDTQNDENDAIYCFVYDDESAQGEERIVYGVRVETVEGPLGGNDLQICFEPYTRTYKVVYDDATFKGENEDIEANAEWWSVRWSDIYYIPTLLNIAENIEEYA